MIVVWAIDPFEKETRPGQPLVRKLLDWARSSNFELQPVYALPLPRNESEEFLEGVGLSRYLTAAEKASERYLRDLGVVGTRPVKVIFANTASRKEEVQQLLKFSKEQNSPCIIVSSHGRSGIQRLVLGSFAENLLHHSTLPIFFLTHLNAEEESEKKITRVLFATDFSDYSREAFLRLLTQAKSLDFELSLFHSVSLPVAAIVSGYGTPVVIPDGYFSNQLNWANAEGIRWAKFAESQGVSTRLIVKDSGLGLHTGETILTTADEERVGLIAVASVSGALSSFVMGSVARDVFRSNRYPVWMYGPKALEKRHHHPTEYSALA